MEAYKVKVKGKYNRSGLAGYPEYGPYLTWPSHCPCCGSRLGESVNRKLIGRQPLGNRTLQLTWNVPYCVNCERHIRYTNRLWNSALLAFFAWAILGAALGIRYSDNAAIPILLVIGLISIPAAVWIVYMRWIKPLRTDLCTNLRDAIVYKAMRNEWHILLFTNKLYAVMFAELNNGSLENASKFDLFFF
jgi:hypothetical protein